MSRWVWALAALGCGEEAADSGPADEPEVILDMDWTLEPTELTFGEVALGAPATTELSLTNTGESDFSIFGFQSDTSLVAVSATTGAPVAPGESTPITADWTPLTDDNLRGTLTLLLSGSEGLISVPVEIRGTAAGPVANLSVDTEDLGSVILGCTRSATVRVANDGNAPLQVESLALDGSVGFSLDTGSEPFPWALAADEVRTFTVSFSPYDQGDILASLTLVSDDPFNPELAVQLAAQGAAGTEVRDTWDVPPGENVTGLFAVNEVVNSTYRDRFQEALPVFFETLRAAGVPFRVSFIHSQTGVVDGSELYIDETEDPEDATEIAIAMVAAAAGDNDYLLNTLELAIGQNTEWLLDDDENWETSKLNLVGINMDQEQSSGNATLYVSHYQAYKEDPADIAVHAIGGDSPGGCPGAEAFTPFSDAAAATGGVFLSICEADWTTHMETLALAFLGEGQVSFALSEVPAEWSIEVYVDGGPELTGWTYNADSNRVSFDEDAYPNEGSELRIQYYVDEECPE
ncbi:hypothetical protein LBMAG42_14890 [Deltaproteobacteria bacterium]|nr:hypothetical protein LBMAG42_14890 [Deltaproteobacteria bacterium]